MRGADHTPLLCVVRTWARIIMRSPSCCYCIFTGNEVIIITRWENIDLQDILSQKTHAYKDFRSFKNSATSQNHWVWIQKWTQQVQRCSMLLSWLSSCSFVAISTTCCVCMPQTRLMRLSCHDWCISRVCDVISRISTYDRQTLSRLMRLMTSLSRLMQL